MGLPLKDIVSDLDSLSENISTQVRSIALGLIAVVWVLLTGLKDISLPITGGDRRELLAVALVAILTLVLDYAQYLFGYLNSLSVLRTAEKAKQTEAVYNRKTLRYRARTTCFVLKQIAALLGAGWLGSIIVRLLF